MSNTKDAQLVPVKQVFEREDVRKRFDDMLGKEATGFIISVINCITKNDLLAKADRDSILFAAATAASMRLPIDDNLGLAYIVPYKGKDGVQRAQFQMGYKGYKQLAIRTGEFETIGEAVIYEGQLVGGNSLTGYEFNFDNRESDKVIGYAAYFKLMSGFNKTLYMTAEEVEKHAKRYSQSYKRGYGSWKDNFEAMALKTVVKLLLSKDAPLSIEMQRAVRSDQGVIKDWEGEEIEYADNLSFKPSLEESNAIIQEARVKKHIENSSTVEELEQVPEEALTSTDLDKLYKDKLKELTSKDKKKDGKAK